MKKLFKKLGIVAIIVGILSPFVSLPKVNAATDGCDHYLNQYFFLDVTSGDSWDQYSGTNGYRTYTSFRYTFPSLAEGQTLTIEKVQESKLTTSSETEKLQDEYVTMITDNDRTISGNLTKYGTVDSYNYTSGDYKEITHVLHGLWAREGEELLVPNYDEDKTEMTANWYSKKTIHGILISKGESTSKLLDVEFSGAKYNSTDKKYTKAAYTSETELKSYFQILVDTINGVSNDTNAIEKKYLIKPSELISGSTDNEYYFNIGIRRKLSDDTINTIEGLKYGYSAEESGVTKDAVWSTTYEEKDGVYKVTDSLLAYKNYKNHCEGSTKTGDCDDKTTPDSNLCTTEDPCYSVPGTYDISTQHSYFWPAILNVEFKVCNTSSTPAQWTLTYDDNVDDNTVTNMPNPASVSEKVGTSIKVSSTIPKRDGYTFQKWCTESNGSGNCYKAGDEVKNTTATKLTLFAQWGKEGTEDNKGTGVISYVIGFAAVGLVATGIYLVSKKKNLFKQI